MAQSFKKPSYGKLPAALRADPAIPKRAGHLFAVMGSYGPESRASLKQLARDIGGTEDTVKALQKLLVASGWVFLLREGKGAGRGKEPLTREWWLNDYAWQHELDESTKKELKRLGLEPPLQNPPSNVEPPLLEPPSTDPPHTTNIKTTKENSVGSPLATRHRQAIAIFKKLWEAEHPRNKYAPTGKDHGNLKVLLQAEIDPEYFKAKVVGYLADRDPFNLKLKHSLSFFCSSFNKWPAVDGEAPAAKSEMEGLA